MPDGRPIDPAVPRFPALPTHRPRNRGPIASIHADTHDTGALERTRPKTASAPLMAALTGRHWAADPYVAWYQVAGTW